MNYQGCKNMWDKQRNEIAMKMKDNEEKMAIEQYLQIENQNMNSSNPNM